MLDIRLIRQSPDEVNAALARRGGGYSIDSILAMDETRRELMKREEALRSERNTLSKEVGRLKQVGQDTDDLQAPTKALADEIKHGVAAGHDLSPPELKLALAGLGLRLVYHRTGVDANARKTRAAFFTMLLLVRVHMKAMGALHLGHGACGLSYKTTVPATTHEGTTPISYRAGAGTVQLERQLKLLVKSRIGKR